MKKRYSLRFRSSTALISTPSALPRQGLPVGSQQMLQVRNPGDRAPQGPAKEGTSTPFQPLASPARPFRVLESNTIITTITNSASFKSPCCAIRLSLQTTLRALHCRLHCAPCIAVYVARLALQTALRALHCRLHARLCLSSPTAYEFERVLARLSNPLFCQAAPFEFCQPPPFGFCQPAALKFCQPAPFKFCQLVWSSEGAPWWPPS
jgi:hypothetical protein